MSTICQIIVEQEGLKVFKDEKPWEETRMLYHHFDGYPQNIIPLLVKAFIISEGGWEAGRAGKVASYLCSADPGNFEPEDEKSLQGDIEFFYLLRVTNKKGGVVVESPEWEVDVYSPAKKWYDAQIACWEVNKGVSSIDDEDPHLMSFDPADYKECITQNALRHIGSARMKNLDGEPILTMSTSLSRMLKDF